MSLTDSFIHSLSWSSCFSKPSKHHYTQTVRARDFYYFWLFIYFIVNIHWELESWNFERMFTPHHVSCVTCHISRVTCHLSPVTCHVSPAHVTCQKYIFLHFHYKKNIYIYYFFTLQKIFDKVVELVGGGSVINGAYPV